MLWVRNSTFENVLIEIKLYRYGYLLVYNKIFSRHRHLYNDMKKKKKKFHVETCIIYSIIEYKLQFIIHNYGTGIYLNKNISN